MAHVRETPSPAAPAPRRFAARTLVPALLLLAGCADAVPTEDVVARAGDYTLTVDEAVELLVDHENLPNQDQVVTALADLWIDYTLLAATVARDSTLSSLDFRNLIGQQLDQVMILQYRDSVLQVDTAVSDAELEELYRTQAPQAQLRARHILLGVPASASQAQRDSVRRLAEDLLGRIRGGASFEELARQYSQDPGTAPQGGDLGTFGRGELVRPVDEAAFALDEGEVSDVIQSPFGYHIVRVDERVVPELAEVRPRFRTQVQQRRVMQAESTFVADIEGDADPRIVDGAFDVVRELAGSPGQRLSGRAARRPLVTWDGGSYTAGEFLSLVRTRPPPERQQMQDATDAQLENFLRGLVQRELIVEAARRAGLAPSPERVDSLVDEARTQLREIASQMGVLELDRAPGEPLEPAVERAVLSALSDVLSGAAGVVPLGEIAFQLREGVSTAVRPEGVGQVILEVGRARAARGASPLEQLPPADSGAPPTPADTAG